MENGNYSSLPSGISRGGTSASDFKPSPPKIVAGDAGGAGGNTLLFILVFASLAISLFSLYIATTAQTGLPAKDREQLRAIAEDLRQVQQKEITLSSPLKTTAYIEESFPISDVFPTNFAVPVKGSIPIVQQVAAQGPSGQIVPLKINTTVAINGEIPIDANKSMSNARITIKKEIPIDTRFYTTLRIQAAYGNEFNNIIDRLTAMSEQK